MGALVPWPSGHDDRQADTWQQVLAVMKIAAMASNAVNRATNNSRMRIGSPANAR